MLQNYFSYNAFEFTATKLYQNVFSNCVASYGLPPMTATDYLLQPNGVICGLGMSSKFICNWPHTCTQNSSTHKFNWGQSLWSTPVLVRPLADCNMYQKGYPSHSMTGGHDSVVSICLTCHVYTSNGHRCDDRFGTAVLCLQPIWLAVHMCT